MSRAILALLTLIATASSSLAQCPGPGIAPEDEDVAPVDSTMPPAPLQVNPPTQQLRVYDRIIYVLDVSGSMTGGPLQEAISVTRVFASDEFLATVITFDDDYVEWGGVDEECSHAEDEPHNNRCLPAGWARLPVHQNQLDSHVENVEKGGGTVPGPALARAVEIATDQTLIVFVSDGKFANIRDETTQALSAALLARREADGDLPQILVWSTQRTDDPPETLVELAGIGGAGLWRADVARAGPW